MVSQSLSPPRVPSARPVGSPASAEECCAPPELAAEVFAPDVDTLARMAKAIAHPARLLILRLLAEREMCVTGDVVAELPLAQSTVSEHLRILREAGLVQGEIEGPRTRYCVNPRGVAALKAGIAAL
jgi:ArsR family transcriptional regulator